MRVRGLIQGLRHQHLSLSPRYLPGAAIPPVNNNVVDGFDGSIAPSIQDKLPFAIPDDSSVLAYKLTAGSVAPPLPTQPRDSSRPRSLGMSSPQSPWFASIAGPLQLPVSPPPEVPLT